MIDIAEILTVNTFALLLLVTLLLSTHQDYGESTMDEKVLYLMVLVNIVQSIVEPLSFLVIGKTFAACRTVSLVLNTLLYLNEIFFALLWVVYVTLKNTPERMRAWRACLIPAIITLLVSSCMLVNLFVPVFFEITAGNIYVRTQLFFIPIAISYGFLLYGAILVYARRKKTGKYFFLPAALFLLPVVLAGIVQFCFYGLSLLWMGTAIGLTSMYICIHKERANVDALSGLYNRQYVFKCFGSMMKRADSNTGVAGILMDIDRFKAVNDTYGHLMGDDAIRHTGQILRDVLPKKGLAIRYAGDEFLLLLPADGEQDVRAMIAKIKQAFAEFNAGGGQPYQLEFSFGYSLYRRHADTLEAFLSRMDHNMYAEKNRKYDAGGAVDASGTVSRT